MRVIADFHIHGPYSRATSERMCIIEIARFAKIKGLEYGSNPETQKMSLERSHALCGTYEMRKKSKRPLRSMEY